RRGAAPVVAPAAVAVAPLPLLPDAACFAAPPPAAAAPDEDGDSSAAGSVAGAGSVVSRRPTSALDNRRCLAVDVTAAAPCEPPLPVAVGCTGDVAPADDGSSDAFAPLTVDRPRARPAAATAAAACSATSSCSRMSSCCQSTRSDASKPYRRPHPSTNVE